MINLKDLDGTLLPLKTPNLNDLDKNNKLVLIEMVLLRSHNYAISLFCFKDCHLFWMDISLKSGKCIELLCL